MRYDSPLPISSIERGTGEPIARRCLVAGAANAAFGMREREVLSAADEATSAGALYNPGVYPSVPVASFHSSPRSIVSCLDTSVMTASSSMPIRWPSNARSTVTTLSVMT